MPVDFASIDEIKTLTDNYNDILEKYIAANKSLSGLGVYEVLSKKKISGGTSSYSGVISTVEACQTKCDDLKCTVASYNTDTKVCQINNTGQVIDGALTEKVIVNKQIYYLNQLTTLNMQLSTINSQIIAKINTLNDDDTFTSLYDERIELIAQLDEDKASLTEQMESTTSNLIDNTNVLDLEYIQRDEATETNSNYYIFLLLLLICIIAIVVLITMQT
jgi:hypothetical protein